MEYSGLASCICDVKISKILYFTILWLRGVTPPCCASQLSDRAAVVSSILVNEVSPVGFFLRSSLGAWEGRKGRCVGSDSFTAAL